MGVSVDEITDMMNKLVDELITKKALWSEPIEGAFRTVPRHLFVDKFYTGREMITVDRKNPERETLTKIYQDYAIVIRKDENGAPTSSTSQPAIVSMMLEDLELSPGMKVLEIGTGTGWNAALMAKIVEHHSLVCSIEIQADVAQEAKVHLKDDGFPNVHVITRHGGYGYMEGAPYDRIITAAGCPDISPHWIDQLSNDGVLLVLLKTKGVGDPVLKLRKENGKLSGKFTRWAGFMKLQGDYTYDGQDYLSVHTQPIFKKRLFNLLSNLLEKKQLPWAIRRYWGIRCNFFFYLLLEDQRTERIPGFKDKNFESLEGFGLWDREADSLCLAHKDFIGVYGGQKMYNRLVEILDKWRSLGEPALEDYSIEIYPIDKSIVKPENGWVMHRKFTQQIFTLED